MSDIVFEGVNNRGFFTSNRIGGKGGDDIYQFMSHELVFTLQGVVIGAETRELSKRKSQRRFF